MKLTDQTWDILIIGGGLAGSVMGLALRNYPGQVAVIDASPSLLPAGGEDDFDQRNIALSDSSRRIFNSLGVWLEIAHTAIAVQTIHVSQKDALGVTRIRAAEEGVESLGWVIPYPSLLSVLQQHLDDADDVSFFSSTTVQSLATENNLVHLEAQQDSTSCRIKARLVILAEGGGKLLQSAGFEVQTFDYQQSAIVTNIKTTQYVENVAYERFTQHGPLAILPLNQQRYGIVWTYPNVASRATSNILAAQVLAWDDAYFAAQLQEDFGNRLGTVTKIGKRACYPLRLLQVTNMVNGPIVALGNAAHTLHPVAGQGFNLTLRDVAFLAQYLFDAPATEPAAEKVLNAWQRSRELDIKRVKFFTDFMARATRLPFASLLSGKFLLAFDMFPLLRRGVVRRSLGLSPPVSRLASGLPLESRPDLS